MKTRKVSVRLGHIADRFLLDCQNVSQYLNSLCELRRQWVFDAVTTVAELGIDAGSVIYVAATRRWPGAEPEAAKTEQAGPALDLLLFELRGPNAASVRRMLEDAVLAERSRPKKKNRRRDVEVIHRRPARRAS